MIRNAVCLTLFAWLIPFLVNDTPVFSIGNFTLHSPIPYGENQFFEGTPPLSPSLLHPLGSDDRGRDLLVRILYGFHHNFLFCLLITLCSLFLASTIALGSVIFSRPLRSLLYVITDATLCLPMFFLLLAFFTAFTGEKALFYFCLCFFWSPAALLIRSEAEKAYSESYTVSARFLGASKIRIAFFHILPNCFNAISTAFPLLFSSSFSLLAYIHYAGITSFEPKASLGELLAQGKDNLHTAPLVLAPLLATIIPIFLLLPLKKNRSAFKRFQLLYLSCLRWIEDYFGKKNSLPRLIKLPQ